MKKNQNVFDEKEREKLLAGLPPKERERIEQNINRAEKLAAKWQREKEAFMKLSKEERLKKLCHEHIGYAFDHAVGLITHAGRTTKEDFREAKRYLRNGLTWSLKEAKVLP